ncbi:hypothetical protein D3C71_1681960 [compost metagenome]
MSEEFKINLSYKQYHNNQIQQACILLTIGVVLYGFYIISKSVSVATDKESMLTALALVALTVFIFVSLLFGLILFIDYINYLIKCRQKQSKGWLLLHNRGIKILTPFDYEPKEFLVKTERGGLQIYSLKIEEIETFVGDKYVKLIIAYADTRTFGYRLNPAESSNYTVYVPNKLYNAVVSKINDFYPQLLLHND